MKKYLLLPLLTLATFACEEQDIFNAIYDKHIQMAKIKDVSAYKSLLTQNAIDEIDRQVTYFKKHGKNRSFIDIVHNSVKTDPLRRDLKMYTCIKKGSKAMVIYTHKADHETKIVSVIFQKEDHLWKMNEYAESDIPNAQFDAYIRFIKNKFL